MRVPAAVALLLAGAASAAPPVSWTSTLNAPGNDRVNAMATVCDALFVAGTAQGDGLRVQADGGAPDAGHYVNRRDGFVARYRPDGGLAWLTYLGGDQVDEVFTLAVGERGQVYVGGLTHSKQFLSGSHDPGGPVQDAFVAELDPNLGTVLWDRRFNSDGGDVITRIVPDLDGGFFFAGKAGADWDLPENTAKGGVNDAVVGHVLADRSLAWVTYLGDAFEQEATALGYSPADGVFLAGRTVGDMATPSWTDVTVGTGTDTGIFAARIDGAGTAAWSTGINGAGDEEVQALLLRGGQLYLGGRAPAASFPVVPDGGTPPGNNMEPFVLRMALDGKVGPSVQFGGNLDEWVHGLAQTFGGVFVAGSTNSGNFPDGGGVQDVQASSGRDFFIARLDPATLARTHLYVYGGAGDEELVALAFGEDGLRVGGYQTDTGGDNAVVQALGLKEPIQQAHSPAFCALFSPPPAAQDGGTGGDAGVGPDGGAASDDGGPGSPVGEPDRSAYGWGCGAVGALPLALALLLLLGLGRRRRYFTVP